MTLTIDVKPQYEQEVLNILKNLKNIMIENISIKKDDIYLKSAKKQVELYKKNKLKTYNIEKLWDILDD